MISLRHFFRRLKEAGDAFVHKAARMYSRSNRFEGRRGDYKARVSVSRQIFSKNGYRKPAQPKCGFIQTIARALKNRRVWLTAGICAAAVAVAVALSVTLGGKSAQATGASDGTSQEAVAVNSEENTGGSQNAAATDSFSAPQPVETSIPTPVTPVATTEPEETELLPGCHDERITEVQEKLMELGYLGIDEPTDYYGYGTEYALQLFQRKHSLQVDGILGKQTMAMLFSADAEPYTVRNGDSGTDVKSIQERLKELKYFSGEITGEFGDRTETAVKNFQKRNGLSPDGIVGEETREALYSDSARSASGSGGGSGGSSGGGGGSHGGGTTIATWEPDSAKVEALIAFAQTLLGKTYVQGGKGPDVFDCSGFVYYSLNHSGYSIGYMTSSGWAKCSLPKVTSMSDLRRGDIICFKGHVGIYLGGGQMIDASSTQGQVRISTNVLTSSYWKRYFICARRLF